MKTVCFSNASVRTQTSIHVSHCFRNKLYVIDPYIPLLLHCQRWRDPSSIKSVFFAAINARSHQNITLPFVAFHKRGSRQGICIHLMDWHIWRANFSLRWNRGTVWEHIKDRKTSLSWVDLECVVRLYGEFHLGMCRKGVASVVVKFIMHCLHQSQAWNVAFCVLFLHLLCW